LLAVHNSKSLFVVEGFSGSWEEYVGGRWLDPKLVPQESWKWGEGGDTSFWLDVWCVSASLQEAFPCLYSLSTQPQHFIKDMWEWGGGLWVWKLKWRRRALFGRMIYLIG
jgi:hypothetical protein